MWLIAVAMLLIRILWSYLALIPFGVSEVWEMKVLSKEKYNNKS
jgi:hypothetical protein